MDSETVGRAAFLEFAQEYNLSTDLLYRDMEVLDPRVYLLKIIELVIMGGEKGLGAMAIFMDIFHDRPGYRHAVVGRCSPSDLIQKDKGTGGKVVEDHGGLQHLDHEG